MSIAVPKMTRYASLNSILGMKSSCSLQRNVQKAEKGSWAEETFGHVFHSATNSAAVPIEHNIRLRA